VLIKCCDVLIDHSFFIFRAVIEHNVYHPRWLESITPVLRKIGKSSYDVAKSYRPIGLIDTIPKVFSTLCSKHIYFLAEKHGLWSYQRRPDFLIRNSSPSPPLAVLACGLSVHGYKSSFVDRCLITLLMFWQPGPPFACHNPPNKVLADDVFAAVVKANPHHYNPVVDEMRTGRSRSSCTPSCRMCTPGNS
jgi:hypothetical protein